MPRADHHLAFERPFAQRPADVIADIGDHAELAVLERDGHQSLAELRFAQWRALEVLGRADVDPFSGLVHVLLPQSSLRYFLPYTVGRCRTPPRPRTRTRTMKRVTWRLLPFLLLLYIISWLDRVNVGFAKLQMNADLGFSETAYGFGAGIFFIGYAACARCRATCCWCASARACGSRAS